MIIEKISAFYIILFLSMASCGIEEEEKSEDPPSTSLTYADVKPTIDTSCAFSGCHVSGFQFGDLSTEEGVRSYAAAAYQEITSGSMPSSSEQAIKSAFDSNTSAKANLLEYLNAGAP